MGGRSLPKHHSSTYRLSSAKERKTLSFPAFIILKAPVNALSVSMILHPIWERNPGAACEYGNMFFEVCSLDIHVDDQGVGLEIRWLNCSSSFQINSYMKIVRRSVSSCGNASHISDLNETLVRKPPFNTKNHKPPYPHPKFKFSLVPEQKHSHQDHL